MTTYDFMTTRVTPGICQIHVKYVIVKDYYTNIHCPLSVSKLGF